MGSDDFVCIGVPRLVLIGMNGQWSPIPLHWIKVADMKRYLSHGSFVIEVVLNGRNVLLNGSLAIASESARRTKSQKRHSVDFRDFSSY